MSEIRAVIFDIGGVLVRTEDPQPRESLGRRFGLDRAGIDALVFGSATAQAAERGEQDEPAVWQGIQDLLSLTPTELQAFKDQFWAGDRLDAALFDWLSGLRPGYKTALLTNSWLRDPLTLFTGRYGRPEEGVRAAFDAVISSAAVGVQKPDARIYRAALDALAVRPEETLFVDDFERNTAAARALGLHTVLFRDHRQAAAEIQALLGD
jgi:FMN phosphatase YigB (HAD superfamily)